MKTKLIRLDTRYVFRLTAKYLERTFCLSIGSKNFGVIAAREER